MILSHTCLVADAYAQRVELDADGLTLAVDGLDDGRVEIGVVGGGLAAAVVLVLDIVFIVFWVNV